MILIAVSPLAAQTDSSMIYLYQGNNALRAGDNETAIKAFNNALRFNPAHFAALKNLGVVYSSTGDFTKAKANFDKAFAIDSTDADLNNNIGALLDSQNKAEEAIRYFKMANEASPNNAVYLTNLGRAYSKVGRTSLALENLHWSLAIDRTNFVTWQSIGSCHAVANQLDSAEYYYQQAIERGGKSRDLFYFLATVKNKLGKYKEAIQLYQRVVSIDPNHAEALNSLGMMLIKDGQYKEAADTFAKLIELRPDNKIAHVGYGVALALSGDDEAGKAKLDELFAIDSALGFQMLKVVASERERVKNK
jgi:tetratricopeptide (TPR) repeat protein